MKWIELKGNDDIEEFLEIFNYFHDSCLKEMLMWTDSYVDNDLSMNVGLGLDTKVRMLFQRQSNAPAAIELLFEEVSHFQLKPSPENYDSIIYDANIFLKDETFYWADSLDWKPNQNNQEITWISSKKVKWREVSHWMGEKRRYNAVEE